MITLNKTYVMWALFIILSVSSVFFSIKYFGKAVPMVNLDLRMNRHEALKKATTIAEKFNVGPKEYQQVASFKTDSSTKIYVELEAGGATAFNKMVTGTLYSPYTWQVRHFQPFQTNELVVIFKPDGTPYGFIEEISDEMQGPALPGDQAEQIAQQQATEHWNINFDEYTRVEVSKVAKPNGRVDHTFVYERPEKIGKADYRLSIVVSGDKMTQLVHYVKIPEAFVHRFKELRSSNETLKHVAEVLRFLLYMLGIGIFGLIALFRRRYLIWKAPLIAGFIISLLMAFEEISSFPLEYISYDTTTPIHTFIVDFIINTASSFVYMLIFSTFIFMVAESLSRLAFKHQPQLWQLWSKKAGSSWQAMGQTLSAYLLVPLFTADVVLFYMVTTNLLGWWTPSDTHLRPNILATYAPWLNAIAPSLWAGSIEECLFRAFPLAAAALLGQYFGKKNWWLVFGFIIQIFIFGAGHADYPGFPAYSRLVELILFSGFIGYVYIKFGLLVGIISHAVYDLMWFSLPLFISTAPHAWVNQLPVIIVGLAPLIIILFRRWQYGSWHQLDSSYLNGAWQPHIPSQQQKNISTPPTSTTIKHTHLNLVIAIGFVGVLCWALVSRFKTDAPAMAISRNQAISIAQKALAKEDQQSGQHWYPLVLPSGFGVSAFGSTGITGSSPIVQQHRFIWQKGGPQVYHTLLGSYLNPACWAVRFIRLSGSLEDRAEEYTVLVTPDGKIARIAHTIPESRVGKILSEEDARVLAHNALKDIFHIDPSTLQEVSAESSKQPHRLDWIFTFSDTPSYTLKEGQARLVIGIDGNELTDYFRYVYVPQEWSRSQKTNESIFDVINLIAHKLITLLWILACLLIVVTGISIQWRHALAILSSICALFIVRIANNWPVTLAYYLNAQAPYAHQLFRLSSSIFVALITTIITSAVGLIIALKTLRTSNRATIQAGIALGFAWAGVAAFIKYIAPSLQPLWGNYNNLGSYSPLITTVIRTLFDFVNQVTFLIFVVQLVNMIKNFKFSTFVAHIVLTCTAILIIASQPILSINHMLISCVLASIFFIFSYYTVFKQMPESIVWFVATILSMQAATQALYNIVPHALLSATCTIASLILVAWILTRYCVQSTAQP